MVEFNSVIKSQKSRANLPRCSPRSLRTRHKLSSLLNIVLHNRISTFLDLPCALSRINHHAITFQLKLIRLFQGLELTSHKHWRHEMPFDSSPFIHKSQRLLLIYLQVYEMKSNESVGVSWEIVVVRNRKPKDISICNPQSGTRDDDDGGPAVQIWDCGIAEVGEPTYAIVIIKGLTHRHFGNVGFGVILEMLIDEEGNLGSET